MRVSEKDLRQSVVMEQNHMRLMASAFCIPQLQFAFEFKCGRPNGNSAGYKSFELPFDHSHSKMEIFFILKGPAKLPLIQPLRLKCKCKQNLRHSKHRMTPFQDCLYNFDLYNFVSPSRTKV